MSENNKSYRIRTNVGSEYNGELNINVNLLQDYDEFEVLSLKIGTENLYKYHTSHYGCIVGRALANGGVGVPNVKISVFIPAEDIDITNPICSYLYPYSSTRDKNRDNIRYNLLTDTKIDDCHQNIGTFPNKRLVLDDNNVIEIYDKYYKFTTTTNGSGDYMLFGIPVGNNIIHSDLDLSDIGILSQKPRDMFYKGYTAKQFENASQFKKDTNLDNLTQVISQDSSVYVFPFWGDETENEGQIKIVRNDIDINYKFEPTCIFIGCIVSDEKSNAISKNCIPHERMGKMDRLTTGAGTIEMIRKTIGGNIESFAIQGNELIDGNGTWCYQIPMNLDYMATDEYGDLVPTDNYGKGIPTRASVRFRVSLADYESDYESTHLVKVLVPNNPQMSDGKINADYEFGSATRDDSFRDLFWNNVYTVKSYIPRFQKGNRQRNKNFTGFKAVNVNGANNPIPYNNMRINLTFLFVFQCLIFKSLILIVKTLNKLIYVLNKLTCKSAATTIGFTSGLTYVTLDGGMCPTLEGNYIAPGAVNDNDKDIIKHTYANIFGDSYNISTDDSNDSATTLTVEGVTAVGTDPHSADGKNGNIEGDKLSTGYTNDDTGKDEPVKIYNQEDYFVKCVELQFAMEYEVIQFDFYNDWINGMIYIPRWFAEIKKNKDNALYCGDTFKYNRHLTQQCAVGYNSNVTIPGGPYGYAKGCNKRGKEQCHKRYGRKQVAIFGDGKGGIVTAQKNSRGQYAYYLKPSEIIDREHGNEIKNVKANLFSSDIVLLGSVSDCNQYGIPKVNGYTSSTYRMPPPTGEIISDTQEMELSVLDGCKNSAHDVLDTYYQSKYSVFMVAIVSGSSIREILNNYGLSDAGGDFVANMSVINDEDILNFSTLTNRDIVLREDFADVITQKINDNNVIKDGVIDKLNNIFSDNAITLGTISAKSNYSNCTGRTEEFSKKIFYGFSKKEVDKIQLDENGSPVSTGDNFEKTYLEVSGIDWGYNPFNVGGNDDTNLTAKQVAGHFLEIGCTFSLSNIKSCVNLQRICEIGAEISQSHYYLDGNNFQLLDPSGIVAKREVVDNGIRSTFATLNSTNLSTIYDEKNGYKKYNLIAYNPVSFMGDMHGRNEINTLTGITGDVYKRYGLIEEQSLSYKAFRFGKVGDVSGLFLKYDQSMYFMPQYENSFYFYFGLRDGNTAIDRLYTEYYAQCEIEDKTPSVSYAIKRIMGMDNHGRITVKSYTIIYNTQNMSMIKSASIKSNGVVYSGASWSREDNSFSNLQKNDYTIVLKDTNDVSIAFSVGRDEFKGLVVQGVINGENLPLTPTEPLTPNAYEIH